MAKRFLTDINLVGNQLINATFEKLNADPTTGNFEGRIYYNTALDILKLYDGTAWIAVGAITDIQGTTNEIEVGIVDGVATISLPSTINANTTGNAATATKLATARAIQLSGDVTGTADFDGSGAINISTAIAANSVALGTDTTGSYVSDLTAGSGISVSGGGLETANITVTNSDKGSSQNIFKNVVVDGVTIVADNNDDTITFTAGTGIGVAGNATTDTLTISNTGVTSIAGTTNEIDVSGSTGSVTLSLPSAVVFPGTVTLNADPTQALHAVTKQYVDAIAEGLHVHASVQAATTANIVDLANPPASIDGVTLTDGIRVIVKDQSDNTENGIYRYDLATTALVRSSDFNSSAEIQGGDFVFVTGGATYDNTGWVQTATVNTIGTDPIVWEQFSGAGTYLAGNGLDLDGNSFSIDTSVTIDVNSIQTLTNKTLTSPTITNPTVSGLYLSDNNIVIEGTTDSFETTLTFTDPTADRNITFKNESGTVALTSDIDALTTSDIEEGTNLYFTDERAQDAVGNNLGLGLSYNDSTGTVGVNSGEMTTKVVNGVSGNSYGIVGNSLYLDVVNPTFYNSEIELDIASVETKLVTDGFTKKVSVNVGNATNTSFGITHNLATRDVQVQVYDNATYDTVEVDVIRNEINTITISFAIAPATNAYRVVIIG